MPVSGFIAERGCYRFGGFTTTASPLRARPDTIIARLFRIPKMAHTRKTQIIANRRQRGGALLVMLVILVMGITTVFVTSLSGPAISNKRNQTTADALARAKGALIGSAVSDGNLPGSLPCPDTNNDGSAEIFVYDGVNWACPNYLGHLPWKSLGISDLRDGSGERLWYALSPTFRDQTLTPHSLNSETTGAISLSGNVSASNLVAVAFAPGAALSGQSRITANENNYAHYLESVVTPATSFVLNAMDNHAGGNYTYNDQLITVSSDDVLSPVEIRIAREAKQCLDSYATAHSSKYPWAADPTNVYYPYSQSNVLFGRFPKHQTPDSEVKDFIDTLNEFQTVVTACANGTGSSATLISKGDDLKDIADWVKDHQPTSPAISDSITSPAKSAGDDAKNGDVTCAEIQANPTGNAIQVKLNQSTTALNAMSADFSWPTGCTLVTSSYWDYWKNQVFYQVDTNYRPGGSGGAASITINGSGNYPAAVLVSSKPLASQTRNPASTTTYLESSNVHSPTSPSTAFETYKPYSNTSVNDLVICLDGNVTCQ